MADNYVSPYLTSGLDVLVIRKDIACAIGEKEAILLNQIHYQIQKNKDIKHFRDGKYWTWETYDGWQEQIPFWSISTIKRTIKSLKDKGIVETASFNKKNWDRTIWYTINHEKIDEILYNFREGHIEPIISVNMNQSVGSNRSNQKGQNEPTNTLEYITKNTTKTSTEISNVSCISKNAPLITDITEYISFVRKTLEDSKEFKNNTEELCATIEYFLEKYEAYAGKEHIRLKGKTLINIAQRISTYTDDLKEMIDRYYETNFRNDYCGLSHFAEENVLELLAYEVEHQIQYPLGILFEIYFTELSICDKIFILT